jgi:hypothetical protein
MADYQVRIDTRKMQQIIRNEPERVDKWLRGVANEILGDIVLSFNTSPAGRTYTRGNVTHIASQPGYPPNVDTGALRASMGVRRLKQLAYEIHDGVEYGVHLEFGTERMAARPFVGPVFDDWQRKIDDDARRNLELD